MKEYWADLKDLNVCFFVHWVEECIGRFLHGFYTMNKRFQMHLEYSKSFFSDRRHIYPMISHLKSSEFF